jgi:hypothetical protein
VRSTVIKKKKSDDEICVSAFRDINIRFPDDVYLLAVWVARSDRAKSTPTTHSHTTLSGLARIFVLAYGPDDYNPISVEDLIAVFGKHGIKGNPVLRLEDDKPSHP